MAFIDRLIGPDEKLIGIARLHWIYGAKGLAWLGGLMLLGGFANTLITGYLPIGLAPIGYAVFWICTVLGVILFAIYYITMLFSEVGLTTERFIYKRGWIMVDVREIDLEEIKSENVDNGILGRILNYGYLQLDARFIKDIGLPAIADPYRFIKALNDARSNIKKDSMRVVLEHKSGNAENVARGLRHMEAEKKQQSQQQQPTALAYHGDITAEDLPHLSDERYDSVSNDPWQNMSEMGSGLPSPMERNVPEEQKPLIFAALGKEKAEKEGEKPLKPDTSQNKGKSKKPRKLFVHTEALHDKVLDDFEEAEEKRTKS